MKKIVLPVTIVLVSAFFILSSYSFERPIAISQADLKEINSLHNKHSYANQPNEKPVGIACYDGQGNQVAMGSQCIYGQQACAPNDCPPGSSPNPPKGQGR